MSNAPRNNNNNNNRGGRGGKRGPMSDPSHSGMMGAPSSSVTPPTLNGPVDLSSFLAGMAETNETGASEQQQQQQALTSPTAAGSPMSAVGGVVRGRARELQSSVKERDPSSTKAEVEEKVKNHLAQVLAVGGARTQSASSASAVPSVDVVIPAATLEKARVTLASDACLPATAVNLIKGTDANRVLVVTSFDEAVHCKQQQAVVDGGVTDKVGYWAGAVRCPGAPTAVSSVRCWYTTFRAVIAFLANFYHDRNNKAATACPFTHIFVVARDGRCAPLFDATLSLTATLMLVSAAFKSTRLVICGVSSVDDIKQLLSAPPGFSVTDEKKNKNGEDEDEVIVGAGKQQSAAAAAAAKGPSPSLVDGPQASFQSLQRQTARVPFTISPSEAAALAGTMVKEHAPPAVSLRRLPGAVHSLPPSLVEHGVGVAVAVLARTVQLAAAVKIDLPLRVAVIGADLADSQTAIEQLLPAKTFALYQDVKEFAAHGNKNVTAILIVGRAVPDHVAAGLRLHIVVDCSTERRAQIPPQAEMQFPIRALLTPTRRELFARQTMAGWRPEGPGIYISTIGNANGMSPSSPLATQTGAGAGTSPSPAAAVDHDEPAEEEDLLDPVCDAVLALAQNGIDLAHMMREADKRRGRATQLQLALPYLNELGCIVPGAQNGNPTTTFIGEITTRCGLAPDFAAIVLHGLVCGLPDAAAFVATAAARSIRLLAKESPASARHGKEGGAVNEYGDTVEDALLLAECAAALSFSSSSSSSSGSAASLEKITAWCNEKKEKSNGHVQLFPESVESALHIVSVVQAGIEDFVIANNNNSSSAAASRDPAAVRRQISDHASLFVIFICAALARRAVVVRHEGQETLSTPSRGNLLFTHTAKEMVPNRFVRSNVAWRKELVVVCSAVTNSPNRLVGSGCTAVSNDFFMGALFALAPVILSYESAGDSALFTVSLNRLEKTTTLPRAVGEQLCQLRERWGTLMSYVQLRRATGAKTAAQFKDAVFTHMDKRFVLEQRQSEFVAELCELVADFRVNVPLGGMGSISAARNPKNQRISILRAPPPPATLTSIAMPSDFAMAQQIALQLLQPGAGKSAPTAASAASSSQTATAASAKKAADDDEEETGIIIDDD